MNVNVNYIKFEQLTNPDAKSNIFSKFKLSNFIVNYNNFFKFLKADPKGDKSVIFVPEKSRCNSSNIGNFERFKQNSSIFSI